MTHTAYRPATADEITQRAYMATITGAVAFFIATAAVGVSASWGWAFGNKWLFIGFALACCVASIAGSAVAEEYDSPMVSLLGGVVTSVALGLLCGPFISTFEPATVVQALLVSVAVVLATGVVGVILPANLTGWGSPILAALLVLIVAQVGLPVAAYAMGGDVGMALTALDVVGVLLFSGIMVYDMNRAKHLPRTLDNGIDVAVHVFVNFANIFIRLLELMGDDD